MVSLIQVTQVFLPEMKKQDSGVSGTFRAADHSTSSTLDRLLAARLMLAEASTVLSSSEWTLGGGLTVAPSRHSLPV